MAESTGEFIAIRERRDARHRHAGPHLHHRSVHSERRGRLPATVVAVDDITVELAPVSLDRRPSARVRTTRPAPVEGARSTVVRNLTKRCFDIALSSLLIAALLPVFATIVLAIRATSPGPAFFRQQRLGRHGVPFRCWKFRTMYDDADRRLRALLACDGALRDEFVATRKLRHDPRVTGIGRLLRRTSLDELPQLFNVLSGEMSIVGPRPIVDEETVLYGSAWAAVRGVRPGMTGLWQVSGRNDLPYDVRVRLDERYARTHSLVADLKILARTADAVVRGRGAY